MQTRTRILAPAAALALVGGLTAAAVAPTQATRTTAAAAGATYLYFDKNWSSPGDSRLHLMKSAPGAEDTVLATYRAGSGNGGSRGTDECAKNAGWLPDGTYKVLEHTRHKEGGPKGINGFAIRVQDKVCKNGRTQRDALFVHSEMNPDGTQGRRIPGEDNPYRWDGDNDYFSLGCVKVTPADIRDLFAKAQRYGWPERLKVVK